MKWCLFVQVIPYVCSVAVILSFLQDLIDNCQGVPGSYLTHVGPVYFPWIVGDSALAYAGKGLHSLLWAYVHIPLGA